MPIPEESEAGIIRSPFSLATRTKPSQTDEPPVWECQQCDVRWTGAPGITCWVCEKNDYTIHYDGLIVPMKVRADII